jgi:hypothetical protein
MIVSDSNGKWTGGERIARMLTAPAPSPLHQLRRAKAQILEDEQRLLKTAPRIFVAMPAYGSTIIDASWQGVYLHPSEYLDLVTTRAKRRSSLLCNNFNHLWATAIQQVTKREVTHFAMLHSDVGPDIYWVDTLYEELVKHDADVVSAVIPIKDTRGLTSTAILGENGWGRRRLTMTEVMALPETFGIEDTVKAGLNPDRRPLLVNTGCWICDLRKPMFHELDEEGWYKIHFTIRDGIRRTGDEIQIHLEPEDWYFSRLISEVNPDVRVFATRRVRLNHRGEQDFPNDIEFGNWKVDEDVVMEDGTMKATGEEVAEVK